MIESRRISDFVPAFGVRFESPEQAVRIQRFLFSLGFRFKAGQVIYPKAYAIDISVSKESGALLTYTTREDVFRLGYGENNATPAGFFEAMEKLFAATPKAEHKRLLIAMTPYLRHEAGPDEWTIRQTGSRNVVYFAKNPVYDFITDQKGKQDAGVKQAVAGVAARG